MFDRSQLRRLQPLHFLAARLHLAGPRTGGEAGDEVVQLRDLFLALLVLGFDGRPRLRLRHDHVVVAARIRDDRLVVDVGDVSADVIQEVAVVRDDDERAVVAVEEFLDPVDRVQVQVVRRFVEQQRRRVAEERLRQQHPHFLSALQLRHCLPVQRVRDIEPLQEDRRVAFGGISVFLADDALELAEAHAVRVGHVRAGVEHVAFLERLPEALVAHDHGVDDAELVEGIVVLAQDAQLRWPSDRSTLGRLFAGQQLHQGGLTRPVGPREPVTPARGERRGHVLEEHLRAEPHGHAADRNHENSASIYGNCEGEEPFIVTGVIGSTGFGHDARGSPSAAFIWSYGKQSGSFPATEIQSAHAAAGDEGEQSSLPDESPVAR